MTEYPYILFNKSPGVGTLETDGTSPESISTAGDITGYYTDANGAHGFVRAANGDITTFTAPGTGMTRCEARAQTIRSAGTVAG